MENKSPSITVRMTLQTYNRLKRYIAPRKNETMAVYLFRVSEWIRIHKQTRARFVEDDLYDRT